MFTSTFALTAVLAISALAQSDTSSSSSTSTSSSTSALITRSASTTASDDFSAQTTITAIVGTIGSGYAGSIIGADACQTTLALSCADDSYACSAAEGVELTITQGPNIYELYYSTAVEGTSIDFSQSCDLDGPSGAFTRAVCKFSVMAGVPGTTTKTSSSLTISGTQYDFQYADIAITAGAERLPTGPASCTETAGGAAAPTGIRSEIYKVIVPVGAVLAAGALM